jgi:hypothetical protein
VKTFGIAVLAFALAGFAALSNNAAAQAQSIASTIRGSWITERDGERYLYIFGVQGDRLSGVVCAKCYDLDNLAFVADGNVEGDGLSFMLVHETGEGEPYRETFRGKLAGGQIGLTVSREGTRSVEVVLERPPPRVAEIFAADRAAGPRPAAESFVKAGPSEPLTPENALGVWRSPQGPSAYLFKQVGDRIMGIVCDAQCADGSYSAFIESATIARNTFSASILHADRTGEAYSNLLVLFLSQGRMTGTYVDSRLPEKRIVHVMVRQDDPAAPKDAVWRGAF